MSVLQKKRNKPILLPTRDDGARVSGDRGCHVCKSLSHPASKKASTAWGAATQPLDFTVPHIIGRGFFLLDSTNKARLCRKHLGGTPNNLLQALTTVVPGQRNRTLS